MNKRNMPDHDDFPWADHLRKSAAPRLPDHFTSRVMDEIERRGISVLPAWRYVALRVLRIGGAIAALVTAMVLADAMIFELRMNGKLELLYFGADFLGSFLGALPYDLILPMLAVAGFSGWLLKSGSRLRVRAALTMLFAYALTGAGGLTLAQSGLNERLQSDVVQSQRHFPMLGSFFRDRAVYRTPHPRFRMGRVLSIVDGKARLKSPSGQEVEVVLPKGMSPVVGDHMRVRGLMGANRFRAEKGQFCNPKRVGRYFRHHQMMRGMMRMRGGMGGKPGMGPGIGPMRGPMRGGMMGPEMGPLRGGMRGPMGGGMRAPMMGPGMKGGGMMGPGMGPTMNPGMESTPDAPLEPEKGASTEN